jgi:hypothetical protein
VLTGTARRLLLVLGVILVMAMAACAGSGDDDDDSAAEVDVTPAASATPAARAPEPGGGATEPAEPTNTTAAATATSAPAQATEPPAPTSTPQATATREATAEPTATEEPAELGEVEQLDPEALPNFTMTMSMDMRGVPDSEDTQTEFEVRQSSVENYYVRIDSEGAVIESWLVDGTNYVRQEDGTIAEMPGGADAGLMSPGMFLSTVPSLEEQVEAFREGEEEVSGRETTHYRIPGEELLSMSGFLGDFPDISIVEGDAEVWIDNELQTLI